MGLMCSSPQRPCDDVCGMDAPSGEARCDTADFLDRPADQRRFLGIIRRIVFGGRRGVGAMPDRSHHGEGEHDQRDMAMPAMPGAGLVVIETKFVLGGLEAVLDRPAMAFHLHQRFDGRILRAPCREEGDIAVGDVAADQQPRVHEPANASS